jgi:bifunctional DNase/RNase
MQMISVVIDSVRKPEEEGVLLVVLKETDQDRYLAVPVGKDRGDFLVSCLEKTEQTKDASLHMYHIVKELLDYGRFKIDRVIMNDIKDGHYLAKIVVAAPSRFFKKQKLVDCYPSDALILAVRTNAPIFVTEALMKEKGLSRTDDPKKA